MLSSARRSAFFIPLFLLSCIASTASALLHEATTYNLQMLDANQKFMQAVIQNKKYYKHFVSPLMKFSFDCLKKEKRIMEGLCKNAIRTELRSYCNAFILEEEKSINYLRRKKADMYLKEGGETYTQESYTAHDIEIFEKRFRDLQSLYQSFVKDISPPPVLNFDEKTRALENYIAQGTQTNRNLDALNQVRQDFVNRFKEHQQRSFNQTFATAAERLGDTIRHPVSSIAGTVLHAAGFSTREQESHSVILFDSPLDRLNHWVQSNSVYPSLESLIDEWEALRNNEPYKDAASAQEQIEKDIDRTIGARTTSSTLDAFVSHTVYYPSSSTTNNSLPLVTFATRDGPLSVLENILKSLDTSGIEYCQGMNVIVLHLLGLFEYKADYTYAAIKLLLTSQMKGVFSIDRMQRVLNVFPKILRKVLPSYASRYCNEIPALCDYTFVGGKFAMTFFLDDTLHLSFVNKALVLDYLATDSIENPVRSINIVLALLKIIQPALLKLDDPLSAFGTHEERFIYETQSSLINTELWKQVRSIEKHGASAIATSLRRTE